VPARVEELHHALEEGIALKVLRSPAEFVGDEKTHFVNGAVLEIMELGEPDASGRRSPVATGKTELMHADLVIMALGNDPNPIIRDSEPSQQYFDAFNIFWPRSQFLSLPILVHILSQRPKLGP
jgi:glutamate synthase (NADPH/NADH) small chain